MVYTLLSVLKEKMFPVARAVTVVPVAAAVGLPVVDATNLRVADASGRFPAAAEPIRPPVLPHRASPIEHSTVVRMNCGLAGVPLTLRSSPVPTIAAPTTPVVTSGTIFFAEVLRLLTMVVGLPFGAVVRPGRPEI